MNVKTLPWMQAAVKYKTPADIWFYAACEFNNKFLANDIGYRVTATGMRAFSSVEAERVRKERALDAMGHQGGGAAAGTPGKQQPLHLGGGGGAAGIAVAQQQQQLGGGGGRTRAPGGAKKKA